MILESDFYKGRNISTTISHLRPLYEDLIKKIKQNIDNYVNNGVILILHLEHEPYYNVQSDEWGCSFNVVYYDKNLLKNTIEYSDRPNIFIGTT